MRGGIMNNLYNMLCEIMQAIKELKESIDWLITTIKEAKK